MQDSLFLCIDVGGTKLEYRFVEQTGASRNCLLAGRLLCAEFSAFHGALHWLLEQVPSQVTHVCIAAAGPVQHESVSLTNLDWHIDLHKIRRNFGFTQVILVNDVRAMMWSLQSLKNSELDVLKYGEGQGLTQVIVAPGTGLGVGIGVATSNGLVSLPSEGGHVSFAPRTAMERELLAFISKGDRHISAESVCSGLGLGTLFRFLSKDRGPEGLDYHALGPWLQAQVDDDGEYAGIGLQVYGLFFDILAEVCGNLAVTCLPNGGMYLAGGLVAKLSSFMDRERFLLRFLDRSVQKNLLKDIPIMQIIHTNPALVGCEVLLACSMKGATLHPL